MSKLPLVKHPIFTKKLPVANMDVMFRPFLVKEEKILLVAKESGTPEDIIAAVKHVVSNCVLTEIDMDTLALTDLEYLWIKIRAKSSNNIIPLSFKDDFGVKHDISIDLEDLEATFSDEHTKEIKVSETFGIVMRYPNIDMFSEMSEKITEIQFLNLMVKCIDYIYDEDKIYKLSQFSKEEIDEFVDSWDKETFNKIRTFFDTMPKISKHIPYTDSEGKVQTINLAGLVNFF